MLMIERFLYVEMGISSVETAVLTITKLL